MSLDVQLKGESIGTLFAAGENDYRFAYKPEVVEEIGAGEPLLSTSLPLRAETYSAEASRAYVEGLLPEEGARERLAQALGIDPRDGYGVVAELGRDLAGAVVFVPDDEESASSNGAANGAASSASLGEDELAVLLDGPVSAEWGAAAGAHCVPGTRHKVALARGSDGSWRLPSAGYPSTHVIKPDAGELPSLAQNEKFCTEVAREVGLATPAAELCQLGGRTCFVSERYDRADGGRIHQESLCQALGFPPAGEEVDEDDAEGPGFGEAAGLLRAVGAGDDIASLLGAAFFNYAIGNGDAHPRNFSLLHLPEETRLAPLYDLHSSFVYGLPTHRGLLISDDFDQTMYLLEIGWVAEEAEFDFERMRTLAHDTADRICASLQRVCERSHAEGWHAPVIDEIVELATGRATGLGYEVEY